MAIKSFKPTSPGVRHKTVSSFEEITTSTPEKSLLRQSQILRVMSGPPSGATTIAESGFQGHPLVRLCGIPVFWLLFHRLRSHSYSVGFACGGG